MRQPFQFIALFVVLACATAPGAARQSDPTPPPEETPTAQANPEADSGTASTDDQTGTSDSGASPTAAQSGGSFRFQLVAEIPLPGPLAEGGPRWEDDRILIETADQLATLTDWTISTEPELTPLERADDLPVDEPVDESTGEPEDAAKDVDSGAEKGLNGLREEPIWSYSASGKYRGGAYPGLIVAEKRCRRCKRGWNRLWKLRVSGTRIAPPVVTETRLYFAAQDDVVYAVKRRNGYRVWSTPINYRSTRPMVRWQGAPINNPGSPFDPAPNGDTNGNTNDHSADETGDSTADFRPPTVAREILLLLTDTGDRMIAIDALDGSRLTEFTIEEGSGRLTGIPLVATDGRVVVARQDYNPNTAALLVLDIGITAPPVGPSTAGTEDSETTDGEDEVAKDPPAAEERRGKQRGD